MSNCWEKYSYFKCFSKFSVIRRWTAIPNYQFQFCRFWKFAVSTLKLTHTWRIHYFTSTIHTKSKHTFVNQKDDFQLAMTSIYIWPAQIKTVSPDLNLVRKELKPAEHLINKLSGNCHCFHPFCEIYSHHQPTYKLLSSREPVLSTEKTCTG